MRTLASASLLASSIPVALTRGMTAAALGMKLLSKARLLPTLYKNNNNIFIIIFVVIIIITANGDLTYRPYSNLRNRAQVVTRDTNDQAALGRALDIKINDYY